MNFPGTWVNLSGTLRYRVVPKCACSTIGQILYFSDNGAFFDGDIHDDRHGVWKWNGNPDRDRARAFIAEAVTAKPGVTFTAVRNPYTRILSCFLDKICGLQRTGTRYRGDMVPSICEYYGMRIAERPGDEFDQIAAFRKFLLFVRDTVKFRHPMPPDIHWSPMASHAATLVKNGGRYDAVIATEDFAAGMAAVLARARPQHVVDLAVLPRFNESDGHGPARAHPVPDYFDDLARHIMTDVYHRDLEVFGYSPDPGADGPQTPLDAAEVTRLLAG